MTLPAHKKKLDNHCVVPRFLSTYTMVAKPCKVNSTSNKFNLFQGSFSALAPKEDILVLNKDCVEIDIDEELAYLKQDSALEITVPVLGITDLLKSPQFSSTHRAFSCPIGINGYGAKSQRSAPANYPFAEFVLITDILGNRYEVIVNPDGKIEIPEDGAGLFSIISSITFIFSEKQIKQGEGLEDLTSCGLKKNYLYLLGPQASNESFVAKICVTHIDSRHQRIVDTIRSVKVTYPEISFKNYQTNVSVKRNHETSPDALQINLGLLLLMPFVGHHPFTASVSLENAKGVQYGFTHPAQLALPANAHGWLQHPVHQQTFTKHFGLSENTLNHLVRHVYSEYDFMKDYLKGETLNLSHQQGYNNFLLRPEAIGQFYDYLTHDIVHQNIPGSFLFDHVPQERLAELDMSHFPVNFHDSVVLAQLQSELASHDFRQLKSLFLSDSHTNPNEIVDHFSVYAHGITEQLPAVSIDLLHHNALVIDDIHDPLSSHPIQMAQEVIHLHDIVDLASLEHMPLANVTHPGFDLNTLLEAQASWTPMMTTSQEAGKEVVMTVQEDNGAQFHVTTQVQVSPLTVVEIDPSHIHTHF